MKRLLVVFLPIIYLSGFLPVEAWTTAPPGKCPAPYVQYGDQVLPSGEHGEVICIIPPRN